MYTRKSLSNNRQARQKGKYIMKKTFYKYTNKFLISMQMNTKKTNKKLKLKPLINIMLYKLKKPGEMSISIGFFI